MRVSELITKLVKAEMELGLCINEFKDWRRTQAEVDRLTEERETIALELDNTIATYEALDDQARMRDYDG